MSNNEPITSFYNLKEMKIVLSALDDKTKISFANMPAILVLDQHFGMGRYIRNTRRLGQRCKGVDADGVSLFIMVDMWQALQKDKRYAGKLRDPKTGKFLSEKFRLPSPESYRYFFPRSVGNF